MEPGKEQIVWLHSSDYVCGLFCITLYTFGASSGTPEPWNLIYGKEPSRTFAPSQKIDTYSKETAEPVLSELVPRAAAL